MKRTSVNLTELEPGDIVVSKCNGTDRLFLIRKKWKRGNDRISASRFSEHSFYSTGKGIAVRNITAVYPGMKVKV